jgi:cyclohexyl-isocyanide hydratase
LTACVPRFPRARFASARTLLRVARTHRAHATRRQKKFRDIRPRDRFGGRNRSESGESVAGDSLPAACSGARRDRVWRRRSARRVPQSCGATTKRGGSGATRRHFPTVAVRLCCRRAPQRTFAMRIGFLVFPNITQLDLTGPYEVFAQMPGAELHLVWKTRTPVAGSGGLVLQPTTTFADCPQLDLVCVPGGAGMNALLTDAETLDFLRRQAAGARYVTSVCTGALVLGAAGLLKGRRAATHWMSVEFLQSFGAVPGEERVVVDGNVITGGGVTAGIDFALRVVAEVAGEAAARAIQLGIEYDPQPPFACGHPRCADAALVQAVREKAAPRQAERGAQVARAAAAIKS